MRRNVRKSRNVGAEVLRENLHGHVGHPVGKEEGVVLAETPIVEYLDEGEGQVRLAVSQK